MAVILLLCIAVFLDRYRRAHCAERRTSSAQAVSQVSNTVENYLSDMSEAMHIVRQTVGRPRRGATRCSRLFELPARCGRRDHVRRRRAAAGLLGLGRDPQEQITANLSFDYERARAGADVFMTRRRMWRPSLTATTPGS